MQTHHPSRKEYVINQYESAQAASEYARANEDATPAGRFFRSRIRLVQDILDRVPGGDLLDAGCGPGVMVRTILESRPHDFSITAFDQSPAMIKHCADSLGGLGQLRAVVGDIEDMPFNDASFDITLLMGALEYTDAPVALSQVSRVTRAGGLVVVTMLNPLSFYRLTEWLAYWPSLRLAGRIEKLCGIPAARQHGARRSGIRAYAPGRLQALMRAAHLYPTDVVHFDVTPLVPPLDRLSQMKQKAQRTPHEQTITRNWYRRPMATAYLVAATRR